MPVATVALEEVTKSPLYWLHRRAKGRAKWARPTKSILANKEIMSLVSDRDVTERSAGAETFHLHSEQWGR